MNVDFGYAFAIMMVEAPTPQPTSATLAPRASLSYDTVERRDQYDDQIADIAGAEEPLGAFEQARMLVAPGQPGAALEVASTIFASPLHIACATWNRPGQEAGLDSSASANACSAGKV